MPSNSETLSSASQIPWIAAALGSGSPRAARAWPESYAPRAPDSKATSSQGSAVPSERPCTGCCSSSTKGFKMTTSHPRVVLITGATSGIGLATARLLAQRHAQIVAVGHTQEALDTVAAELRDAVTIRADMT